MANFLKGIAALLLALVLSFVAADAAQYQFGIWLRAGEEWAAVKLIVGAWAVAAAAVFGIASFLARGTATLKWTAAALIGVVLAAAIAMVAVEIYLEPPANYREFLGWLIGIAAPLLLTVVIQWGIVCIYRNLSEGKSAIAQRDSHHD